MNNKYKPRILDKLLQNKMNSVGGILILGPKDIGKT
jgi:hypothetical protein